MIKFSEVADNSLVAVVGGGEDAREAKAGFRWVDGMVVTISSKTEPYEGTNEKMEGAAMMAITVHKDNGDMKKQANAEFPLPGVFKTLNISGGFYNHSIGSKEYEKASLLLAEIVDKKVKVSVRKVGYMIAGAASTDGNLIIGANKYPSQEGTLLSFTIVE